MKVHPSTALSLAALFVALGGTSYAAFKLPAHSVGTKQLRNDAVTRPKINDQAVGASQVATGSLTGTEIEDGSVTADDLAPGTIPANTLGYAHLVAGPKMPVCGAAPCNVAGSTASCPSGERVISGGADNYTGGTYGEYSEPTSDRTAWIAGVANGSTYNGGWVQAHAICASIGQAVASRAARPTLATQRDARRALARLRHPRTQKAAP